ncbi:MAG: MazG nucleotide pyrophosphohydrolase domain-containing protein [Eubacterium sp.]
MPKRFSPKLQRQALIGIIKTVLFLKLNEEINELKIALSHNNLAEIEDEFGDVLFFLRQYFTFYRC